MSFGAVIAGGAALAGAYVSKKNADKQSDAANKTTEQAAKTQAVADARIQTALDNLAKLTPPNLQDFIRPYQEAVAAGQITPEQATFKMQEASALEGIRIPEVILNAQRNALDKISQIADSGGMTAIDKARLLDIQDQQAARSRAEQEAILQNAQQRGVAGSGVEMAARLTSQQGAANAGARAAADVAAEAQRRQLEAIAQQGNMANAQRTQAFNEAAKVGEAKDLISNFNTSFQNKTDAANVAARNAAQAANLAEAQRIQEFNIGQREREAAARQGAAQSNWTNTLNLQTGQANLAAGQASQAQQASNAAAVLANQQNQQATNSSAAIGQQLASGANSLIDAYGNYETKKKKDEFTGVGASPY